MNYASLIMKAIKTILRHLTSAYLSFYAPTFKIILKDFHKFILQLKFYTALKEIE